MLLSTLNLYCTNNWQHACHACIGKRITRGKGLLHVHVAFHSVCDYCEVLCEILIFGYHISLISYFLDGVHGLEHNNFFLENSHKAVFIAIISFVFLSPINGMPYLNREVAHNENS